MKKLLALAILACIPLALAGCGVTSSPPPPPAVATRLSVSPSSAPPTAGTPFSFTVSAVDANGGFVPSYSGTAHITSSDPQAVLPPDAALTSGTGTFQVTFKTVGVQTISANDPAKSLASGTSNPINVSPGATTKFTVSSPSPVTSGFSISVTVTAFDAFGNQATNYAGTVHLTSSDAQAVLPPDTTLVNGGQVFSPVTLKTITAQTVITATDTVTVSIKGVSNSINVVSNAATHLSLSAPSAENIRVTFSVAVQALDAANNVSAGYTGTVHFMSSDSGARLPVDSKLTAGTANFSVTLESVGSGAQTVTATDTVTASLTASSSVNVTDVALAINSGAPPSEKVGVVYGANVFKKCVYNPFLRRVFCTLCTYTPTNTCGTYPPCSPARLYPCIESVFQGFRFTGTGGVPPYNTWTVVGLPPGLSVNSSSGELLGTPTSPGQYPLTVTMTDSGLPRETLTPPLNLTLTVDLPDAPVVQTASPPPPAVLGQPYSYTFTASGYPPLKWTESGALPAGPTFSNTGVLSGPPTGSTGSFPISVTATDQFNQPSTAQAFTVVVTAHGFIATGSMATARRFHTATLLSNGKVLVAGGEDAGSTAFASAEIYDPSTGVFSPTGNMTIQRVGHAATLLTAGPNAGKVLITGGSSGGNAEAALSSAELFDPAANGGAGAFTATGSMTAARVVHTATLLKDGRVLVAGGDVIFFNGIQNTNISSLASAEIFDPSKGSFTATGAMTVARESHTATLLSDGKVLVAGGSDGTLGATASVTLYASAEIFDPTANGGVGAFTATAGMMTTSRDLQTANLLSGGRVLIAGGASTTGGTQATADLFNPTNGSFAATGAMTTPRYFHDASVLKDGTVLLTGGSDDAIRSKATAEIYDPSVGTFSPTGSMSAARVWHTSTLLNDGTVLVTGGADINSLPLKTAEVYH